jgi:hypothetical protein
VTDLALVLEGDELAQGLRDRNLGVDPVQLEEVDPLKPEVAQRELALLAQVLGAADRPPVARPARVKPALVAITRSSG